MSSVILPYSYGQSLLNPNEVFNLTDFYGNTVALTANDIREWSEGVNVQAIAYGVDIGLSSILLLIMSIFALQNRSRLRRPIFVLNLLGLSFTLCRGVVNSMLLSMGSIVLTFLNVPPQDEVTTFGLIILNVLSQLFLYSCILATLILQIHAVLSENKTIQTRILVASSVTALFLTSLQVVRCVFTIRYTSTGIMEPSWVDTTFSILFVCFVSGCSIILLYKLSLAIRQRKRLGITKFGPFQILIISSCQCLVAPSMPIPFAANCSSYLLHHCQYDSSSA
jgi:pheromone alpha factor receptor